MAGAAPLNPRWRRAGLRPAADLPFEIIDAAANMDGEAGPHGRGLRDAAVLNGKSPGSRATSRTGTAVLLRIPTHPLHGAGAAPCRRLQAEGDGGKLPTMAMTA